MRKDSVKIILENISKTYFFSNFYAQYLHVGPVCVELCWALFEVSSESESSSSILKLFADSRLEVRPCEILEYQ